MSRGLGDVYKRQVRMIGAIEAKKKKMMTIGMINVIVYDTITMTRMLTNDLSMTTSLFNQSNSQKKSLATTTIAMGSAILTIWKI